MQLIVLVLSMLPVTGLLTSCRSETTATSREPSTSLPTDSARYLAAAAYSESRTGDALLIMRRGTIVFERYVAPTTANSFHLLASGTKSFACAIYALGSARGYWTLGTPAREIIQEWNAVDRKRDIELRHLLSLSSGLAEADGYNAARVPSLNTYDLGINGTKPIYAPDHAALYTPTTFQVIAALLERKNGGVDPVSWLERELFTPLGIASDATHPVATRWTRDANGKPQMAGGAYMTAREWARYGQLILQRGRWGQTQLLPADRVQECLTYRSPAYLGYGLSWWLNRPNEGSYSPALDRLPEDGIGDGDQIAKAAPADMVMAAGAGKQRLYVIPSLELVIVRYGRISTDANPWSDGAFLAALLGAQ